MKSDNIKCTIYDCKHCDTDRMKCVLPSIHIAYTDTRIGSCENTMCASYKER